MVYTLSALSKTVPVTQPGAIDANMLDLIEAFKHLPRPLVTASGVPNHWVFRIRHFPSRTPFDMLIIVQPHSEYRAKDSRFQLQAGPFWNPPARVEAILTGLLKSFVKMASDTTGAVCTNASRQHEPVMPWSWSTDDADLAAALEPLLRTVGLPKGLCAIGTCSRAEKDIMDECWSAIVGRTISMQAGDAKAKLGWRTPDQLLPNINTSDSSQWRHCRHLSESVSPKSAPKRCQIGHCTTECQEARRRQHNATCISTLPQDRSGIKVNECYNMGANGNAVSNHLGMQWGLPSSFSQSTQHVDSSSMATTFQRTWH